jgi:tetratricopeptide (TPR) repeat protein
MGIIAAILLLVTGAGGAWFKLRGGRTATELDAAAGALRRHNPAAARPPLDRVLAVRPDHPQALLLAAQAARRTDDYAAAERCLTAFEVGSGETEASRLEWALLGVQQADFVADEERLRTAVGQRHPEEAAILEALAKGYGLAGRWQEAMAALARLLDRDPGHAPGLVLRAAIADRFRRADEAEADVRKAVEVAPDNAVAQAAFADHLYHRGRTREAIYRYELARRLRPADAATRIGLARALTDAADLAEAERQLDGLPADDLNHVEGLVERGRVLLRLGRPADAEVVLELATGAAPWHRDAHLLRLLALKDLGRRDTVTRCEARIAELTLADAEAGRLRLKARDTPGDVSVRMALWEWSKRNGQPEEEVSWLAEVLRLSPGHGPAHAAFADYFDRAGQPRRAARHRAAAQR